ncbi:MAG: hypothetical protein JRJ72_08635 [Deltaproteobacteria bacterium]|nr:hypothetical protein [Deltaproteobacteria bacterium]
MHDPHDHDHSHHDHHHHEHAPHHHHEHDHGHGHPHDDTPAAMPFAAKLVKRLEHWHRHNEDHLGDYQQWVAQADRQGHPRVAAHLREVAELTRQISERLAQALAAARENG